MYYSSKSFQVFVLAKKPFILCTAVFCIYIYLAFYLHSKIFPSYYRCDSVYLTFRHIKKNAYTGQSPVTTVSRVSYIKTWKST